MKEYKSKITKERLNNKEQIRASEFIQDSYRRKFYELNQKGKAAVNKFVDKAAKFLQEVDGEFNFQEFNVSNVIDDVKKTRKMYLEDFVILSDYIISEEKLRSRKQTDIDDEFILL